MGKIEFKLKKSPSTYNIPLSSILVSPIDAKDVIQIDDYSYKLSGNIVDINSVVLSDVRYDADLKSVVANVSSVDNDILITNRSYLDSSTGKYHPLWYSHTLSTPYYNKTYVKKTLRRRIRKDFIESDRIFTYLSDSNNSPIINGSIEVTRKLSAGSAYETIQPDAYSVNYSEKKIVLSNDVVIIPGTTNPIYEIVITYEVLNLDLLVIPLNGECKYIVDVYRPILTVREYFCVEILADTLSPFRVVYKYANENGEIKERDEYTIVCPIFKQVDDSIIANTTISVSSDKTMRRMYSLNEVSQAIGLSYNIRLSEPNMNYSYYITSNREVGTKIKLGLPINTSYKAHWYLTIPSTKVISYEVLPGNTVSKRTYDFTTSKAYKTITEKVEIIGSNLVSLSHKNPIISKTSMGSYSGIVILRNNVSVEILYVDRSSGTICLNTDVSKKEHITATYTISISDYEITNMCFNPIGSHQYHNKNTKKMAYLICTVASEYLNPSSSKIFIKELPKFRSGRAIEYNIDIVESKLNSPLFETRKEYREDMGLPDIFMTATELHRIEPIGLVYLSNPLDEDGFLLNDVRVYGGGTKDSGYSCYDSNLYDGESVDLSAKLHYIIPKWVYDDLRARALEYDENISHLSDKESRVDSILDSYIKSKLEKYSQLGTEFTYEVL